MISAMTGKHTVLWEYIGESLRFWEEVISKLKPGEKKESETKYREQDR